MIKRIENVFFGFVVIITLIAFVFKSEYYPKISALIWGKEARRCDAGLIIKIE